MKKLEDFQAEKVNVSSIYGGKMAIAPADTMTIVYSGTEVCDVKSDGLDDWS